MKIFVNLYPSRISTLLKKEDEEENSGGAQSLEQELHLKRREG
jgi:hypothetical protein